MKVGTAVGGRATVQGDGAYGPGDRRRVATGPGKRRQACSVREQVTVMMMVTMTLTVKVVRHGRQVRTTVQDVR